MSATELDVVCMGEPMLEFVRVQDDAGRPLYLRGFGGDTSNCAIAAARQGARVGYITAVGADRFGDMLLDLWRAEAIDVSGVLRDPSAPTAVYFIEPSPEGRDFTYYRTGSAASRLVPERVPEEIICRTRVFQTSSISQAISETACDAVFRALAIARENGVKVAYDTNLRLGLWSLERARAIIHETLRHADILLPSLDEARLLTGLEEPEAILGHYLEYGPDVLALTCGADGVWVAAQGRIEHIRAPRVATIDTSGAGDTFAGSLLARLAAGDQPFDAALHAVTTAALSTTGYGAVGPIPDHATTRAALAGDI